MYEFNHEDPWGGFFEAGGGHHLSKSSEIEHTFVKKALKDRDGEKESTAVKRERERERDRERLMQHFHSPHPQEREKEIGPHFAPGSLPGRPDLSGGSGP